MATVFTKSYAIATIINVKLSVDCTIQCVTKVVNVRTSNII